MDLRERAIDILRCNDRGGYTVPTTSGLYPAQWNWDSCLVALGFAVFDESRAVTEIETLFQGQWPDGMVPHILFHGDDSTYFPNASVWQAGPTQRSSGITQPPVAATVVRLLQDRTHDPAIRRRLLALVPNLLASHRWFYAARDPHRTGLVSLLHPWESGMDNSPVWDQALARVEPGPSVAHLRKDIGFAASSHRPTGPEYDRYINLVLRYRDHRYDAATLYDIAPFRVADIGFNAILQRANRDLHALLDPAGDPAAAEVADMMQRTARATEQCWSSADGFFYGVDTMIDDPVAKPGIAGFLPFYADETVAARHPALAARLERWLDRVEFGVPSFEPGRPEFEPLRYWRGPVWLVVNWMLIDGLARNGRPDLADRIRRSSLDLVERSGFAEYFNPLDGAPLGGPDFSWTAAMYLHLSS